MENITEGLELNIQNLPILESSPKSINIQVPPNSRSFGITIDECTYHNLPYICQISTESPIRQLIPSNLHNNAWILAIENIEPSTGATVLDIL